MAEKLYVTDRSKAHGVKAVSAVGNHIAAHAAEIIGEPFEFIEQNGLSMSIEFYERHAVIHVTKNEAQIVEF